jgi:nitrite reductase (NADH) small subunit
MTGLIKVIELADIPPLGARVVTKGSLKIAIFRADGDSVFAIEDKCPHKGGPLSQGIVHGCRVTCPLHNMVIDLAEGRAIAPDEGKVRTFEATVTDGAVWLNMTDVAAI